MTIDELLPFIYALAIGLLIGFERERSHPPTVKKVGGSRTFALVALVGSLAAYFGVWVVVAGFIAVSGFLIVGYRRTSFKDPGTTTEIALFATYLLGALVQDEPVVAISLGIIVTVLLASKARLHGFARSVVSESEFDDALKFAVIAFVVFPLLPNRELGPYGAINPHEIWLLVVAFTGISWVGYIAVRVLGPRRGTLVTGLAGGFISASATTAAMGRRAQAGDEGDAVAAGLLASVATYAQLEAIMVVASPEIAMYLWPSALAGAVLLIVLALLGHRRGHGERQSTGISSDTPEGLVVGFSPESLESHFDRDDESDASKARPFALRSALVLAAVLTGALLLGRWASSFFGTSGVYFAAGAAGLADAHAGALASAELYRSGAIDLTTALLAVAVAMATNTLTKMVLGFSTGGRSYGLRLAIGVLPSVALFVASIGLTIGVIGP